MNQNLFYALASGDSKPLATARQATCERPPTSHSDQFLRNHDVLDLGLLSDKQR